eukprot:Skav218529  [mRNA]  locus=scaffold2478:308834:319936:- [translate_table: standard]
MLRQDRLEDWEKYLTAVQDVVDVWLKAGTRSHLSAWKITMPGMCAAGQWEMPYGKDIMQQMPTEGRLFREVDGTWREIMASCVSAPKALEARDSRLNDYLETKRLFFPRFFFLSNDNLLEILSETKDPKRVNAHVKKCFEGWQLGPLGWARGRDNLVSESNMWAPSGMQSLQFEENSNISGMISPEKAGCELVPLTNYVDPVAANGAVEKWLVQVEDAMLESIRDQSFQSRGVKTRAGWSRDDYVNTAFVDWVQKWPGQVVIGIFNLFWTAEALEQRGNAGLVEYATKLDNTLTEIVNLVRREIPKLVRCTLEALIDTWTQSGANRPKQDVSLCAICAQSISADTKSPYPGFCHTCYQSQERIEAAIADLKAPDEPPPLPPPGTLPDPEKKASQSDQEEDKAMVESQGQNLSLPEGYTHEQLVKDFLKVSSSPDVIASHDQERWVMYGRAALLLQTGVYRSALQAEQKCQKLALNRNKLSKVRAMLQEGSLPAECPEEFRVGQNPKLTLTQQEKLDLLQVVRFHAKSSIALTVPQIKKIIVAFRMSKSGMFDDQPPLDIQQERIEEHFHHYDTVALWRNFKQWTQNTQEKADWLSVKNLKQKSVAEVSALTPDTVVKAMVELQDTLLEMGIAERIDGDVVVKQSEAYRICTCDEKGL